MLGLVLACALMPWFASATGPGDLDPDFGEGGRVITDLPGGSDGVNDVAILRNGKIVAVGFAGSDSAFSGDLAIARYKRDGSLDAAFGDGGVVVTDFFGGRDEASAVAVQPDGKIVVVGTARAGANPDFAVARYDRDGTLDATFGSGGTVTTDISGEFDQATGVALQANGRIVVVGETRGTTAGIDFAVVRYRRDGRLDTAFGDGGIVITDFAGGDDSAHAVALRPDGRIVVAGVTEGAGPRSDFALACYHRDGSLNAAFGNGGRVTTDFAGSADSTDIANALAVLPNGKIIVAGTAHSTSASMDFALARYRSDGRLDRRFGSGGRVTTDFFGNFDIGTAVAVDSHDRILVAGAAFSDAGRDDFAVARYRADGRLDERFGNGGKVATDFFGGSDGAQAVAVQPNGKIVVGGIAVKAVPVKGIVQETVFALVRYRAGKPRCEETELVACLDEDVNVGTGRSRWVTELSGAAAYLDREGGFCGPRGYYYVAQETGRIRVEVDVARAGRYELRFRYRVGSAGQADESVRVLVGGETFDFRDEDLENSDRWELSPPLEVALGSGRQTIEFLSIGRDSVHLDEVSLEGGCERD
jgi:uncharacterized delta-60 repeat protein